jgi:hypothetical protein
MAISLKLNGTSRKVEAAPGTPLLWVIRDELKLTGAKSRRTFPESAVAMGAVLLIGVTPKGALGPPSLWSQGACWPDFKWEHRRMGAPDRGSIDHKAQAL